MGTTPLRLALNNGHDATAQCLLKAGGLEKPPLAKGSTTALTFEEGSHEPLDRNANSKDRYGRTAVHLWAYSGDKKLGDALLKLQGIDFDVADCFGRTPLHYSVIEGHSDVVTAILSRSVNVNSQDKQGYFPLHWTSQYRNRIGIAKLLIEKGADITMKDNFGWTAFRKAAENNNVEMGRLLLETNLVYVNEKTPDGKTALHRTAINGSYDFAQFLLENGADRQAEDNIHKRPLDYAGQHQKMTELLS
jgi:ankyrin repeat protein